MQEKEFENYNKKGPNPPQNFVDLVYKINRPQLYISGYVFLVTRNYYIRASSLYHCEARNMLLVKISILNRCLIRSGCGSKLKRNRSQIPTESDVCQRGLYLYHNTSNVPEACSVPYVYDTMYIKQYYLNKQ